MLAVTHVHSGALSALRGGDLLLSVDGVPVRSLAEAEEAAQRDGSVQLGLLRDGAPIGIVAPTAEFDGLGAGQDSNCSLEYSCH